MTTTTNNIINKTAHAGTSLQIACLSWGWVAVPILGAIHGEDALDSSLAIKAVTTNLANLAGDQFSNFSGRLIHWADGLSDNRGHQRLGRVPLKQTLHSLQNNHSATVLWSGLFVVRVVLEEAKGGMHDVVRDIVADAAALLLPSRRTVVTSTSSVCTRAVKSCVSAYT